MATKTIAKCSSCGYPLAAEIEGQIESCPNCGAINEAISQGVTIPTWIFASSIGLGLGIVFGPAILASTDSGAKYLAKKAQEKLSK